MRFWSKQRFLWSDRLNATLNFKLIHSYYLSICILVTGIGSHFQNCHLSQHQDLQIMWSAFRKIKLFHRIFQPTQDHVKDWNWKPPSWLLAECTVWTARWLCPSLLQAKGKANRWVWYMPWNPNHCKLRHMVTWSMRSRLKDLPAKMPHAQNWELFAEASWLLLSGNFPSLVA